MGNLFNQDFRDLIKTFNEVEVEYILVGGYAVILNGYNRTTGDLDLWVNQTEANYNKLILAFRKFGLPDQLLSKTDFLTNHGYDVFTFGRPPVAVDIMTAVKGLEFEEANEEAKIHDIDDLKVRVLHYQHLITAKQKAGRYKDLNDIEHLEKSKWKKD